MPAGRPGRLLPDARLVAIVAVLVALSAIALEIAYAIGHFVMGTVSQIHP